MKLSRSPKRVFLAVGNTDIRKSINGLCVWVERSLDLDPFAGAPIGAQANATFFSLIKRPRLMAWSPMAIFGSCLNNYPLAQSEPEILELLPSRVNRSLSMPPSWRRFSRHLPICVTDPKLSSQVFLFQMVLLMVLFHHMHPLPIHLHYYPV